MKKTTAIAVFSFVMILSLLSGCISDDGVTTWEGSIEDLILDDEYEAKGYVVDVKYYSEEQEFNEMVYDIQEHDFKEGIVGSFTYNVYEVMVIETVARYGTDKMDDILDEMMGLFDEEESYDYTEIDLGSYGDKSIEIKIISEDIPSPYAAYTVVFIKDDIAISIFTVSVDDDGDLIDEVVQEVLDKF